MTGPTLPPDDLPQAARRLGLGLLAMCRNRFELISVELQEERARLIQALLMTLGIAVLGLLAGISLTGAVAILLWEHSPGLVLIGMAAIQASSAWFLYRILSRLLAAWTPMQGSLQQLEQDREALQRILS
jgi:uncharacterized membrane protein YqjE